MVCTYWLLFRTRISRDTRLFACKLCTYGMYIYIYLEYIIYKMRAAVCVYVCCKDLRRRQRVDVFAPDVSLLHAPQAEM